MRWEQLAAGLLDLELLVLAQAVNRTEADVIANTVSCETPARSYYS
jgi:hypothetical protein